MLFKFPITDRSEEDILVYKELFAKGWSNFTDAEKEEWLEGLKGAINHKDINAIQNNIELINRYMDLGLTVTTLDGWFVDTSIFEEIRYNLMRECKEAPDLPYNTYQKWNEVEQLLKDCYVMMTEKAIKYKGETAYRLGLRVGSQKGIFKI